MQLNAKLPVTVSGVAELMQLSNDEIRAWPHFGEVAKIFEDYNYGMLRKEMVIARLLNVSAKCANESADETVKGGQYHYATGIDNAILAIKFCF